MASYKTVAVGGTFDPFHKGHEAIIRKAFEIGEYVFLGVTDDAMIQNKMLSEKIHSVDTRLKMVKDFLKGNNWHSRSNVFILHEPYGLTITDVDLEAIVVSPETEPTAFKINEIRTESHLKPLDIITISFILAEDEKRISSSRIRKGELDLEGHILHP